MTDNSKALSKWSDRFMFTAEESKADEGVKAYLLGGPNDPLGQIAACCKMYKGEVVRDLRDVTDDERREYLREIQKTILTMPLEAVSLHFMIEGVTRSLTHQAVRQRTAAYAQESMRFAVKEDMATAVAYPPSLVGTLSLTELVARDIERRQKIGLQMDPTNAEWMSNLVDGIREEALNGKYGKTQRWRILWDDGLKQNSEMYLDLVNDGMPAEDARGSAWHNVTTRYNYITNLRNFYGEMAKRLSDQAQFEWRSVAMHLALAMRQYGEQNTYQFWETYDEWSEPDMEVKVLGERELSDGRIQHLVERSSYWQYEALSNEMKPVEFVMGGPAFGANFDRPSRIGERVREFAKYGVPSSEWTTGSIEHGIPPIHPEEWLLDPNSARLPAGVEFDVFGNRVPEGTGWHFRDHGVIGKVETNASGDGEYVQTPIAGRWPRDWDPQTGEFLGFQNKPGAPVSQDDIDSSSEDLSL